MIVVIMGVTGAGKSTVGSLLAEVLGCEFLDGDSLHSPANIEKMAHGVPLTDADRAPWLDEIHAHILRRFNNGSSLVVACSALKERYRETLSRGVKIHWVYLKGSEELIREHLQRRHHHFMTAEMLASQFADLEEPKDAIVIDVAVAPAAAVQQILDALSSESH
jgi:gluconokinase